MTENKFTEKQVIQALAKTINQYLGVDALTNEQIIQTHARTFDRYTDPVFISSTDSRYLHVNTAVLKFVGLKKHYEMQERFYEEVKAPIFEDEDSIQAWKYQDEYLLNNPEKNLRMLEIHPNGVSSPYINSKIPILNESNECIGSINHIKFLEVYRPNDFIKGRLPGSLLLNKPDDFFTERQCEIIFLKLQGMTAKMIGKMLDLSHRTIDNSLQSMYQKAGVSDYTDFEEFCEKRNLHRYLPKRFINPERHSFSGSFEVEEETM